MGDRQWNNIFIHLLIIIIFRSPILPSTFSIIIIFFTINQIFSFYSTSTIRLFPEPPKPITSENQPISFAPVVVGFQRFHCTNKVEQVEDCVRDTFVSFIIVMEVYLVVPGYQIHLVSVHRKSQSWLTYMFFFITMTEVYLGVSGYQIHLVSVHQKS